MAKYNEQMQAIWDSYVAEGNKTPASVRDVADWAIGKGLWKPKPADVITQCANDLSKSLREDYRTDSQGIRYRTKHAVRTEKDGKQVTLWDDIDHAPRDHMFKAFAQRRKQVVGDCYQLKTDVDHYNNSKPHQVPIQMVLDFTDDVAEIQSLENIVPEKAA